MLKGSDFCFASGMGNTFRYFLCWKATGYVFITNRSERGNVIAEVSRNLGYQSTRIPDQPRRGSLELMKKELIAAQAGGIAVDGPLGPRHRVKSGVIRIASAAGFDLLPISMDSRRKIVFEKRWGPYGDPPPLHKGLSGHWRNHHTTARTSSPTASGSDRGSCRNHVKAGQEGREHDLKEGGQKGYIGDCGSIIKLC